MKLPSNLSFAVCYFFSGFIFLAFLIGIHSNESIQVDSNWCIQVLNYNLPKIDYRIFLLLLVPISISIGLFFDTIRYVIIEKLYKILTRKKINYKFFLRKKNKFKIKEISDHYYTFYLLDLDIAIGLFILIVYFLFCKCYSVCEKGLPIIIIAFILFILDSLLLRKKIVTYTNRHK
jgi:hypothetical protein